MPGINVRFFSKFKTAYFWAAFFLVPFSAHADALKQLAEANNEQYRQVRALGLKATPGKIDAINKKTFGPPLRALAQEHASKFKQWSKGIRELFSKDEIKELFGFDSSGRPTTEDGKATPLGDKAPKDGGKAVVAGAAAAAPTPIRGVGRGGQSDDTGAAAGADGAKDVGFGGARKKAQPKVNADGIIID